MSQPESNRCNRRQMLMGVSGAAALAFGGTATALGNEHGQEGRKKKRVLVAIGDFSEGLETYYMVYRLIEAGVQPVVAAPSVKRLQMVVHDFDPGHTNYIEMTGYCIQTEVAYKDIQPAEYDALLIPGGRGPEEIRQNADALAVTRHFLEKKLPLGAMCHGPQVIYAAGSVKGRRIAAFHGIRPDVELAGARFVDEPVVVDGSLVTSRGWPDLSYFMREFLKVLAKA